MQSCRRPSRVDRLRTRLTEPEQALSPAVRRRGAIIEAAGTLFVERGVDATTVDEIALSAGVAKGTFYHHFDSKADVVGALREGFCETFLGRVDAAVTDCQQTCFHAKLNAWIATAVDSYAEMYRLHDVVFYGAEMPVRVAMGDEPIVRHLAALLEAGNAAGAWATEEPHHAALVMFHGMHGAVDEAIVVGFDPACAAQTLMRLFARMIGSTAAN